MRGVYQHDDNDCGLACVLTICKQFHMKVDERVIRSKLFLGKDGLSLYGITEVLAEQGISSSAVECDYDELYQLYYKDKKPVIVMIDENDEFHYVVLYKCNERKIYIWDPNKGRRIMKTNEFQFIWTGYAVSIVGIRNKTKNHKHQYYKCLEIFKEHRKSLLVVLLFAIILMVVSIGISFVYRDIIDGIKYEVHSLENIKDLLLGMGFCYIIMMIIMLIKDRIIIYSNMEMEVSLTNCFLKSLLNMPISKKEDYSIGGILERYYRLSSVIKTFSSIYSSVILEVLSLIASTIIMITIEPTMFFITNIIVVSYVIVFFLVKRKLFVLSKSMMDKQSVLITHIKETVQNLISIKSFGVIPYRLRIEKELLELKKEECDLDYLDSKMGIILQLIENVTMLVTLAFGLNAICHGTMTLGTLLAYETFVGFYLTPVKNLLGVLPSVQEVILAFHKIEDILFFSECSSEKKVVEQIKGEMVLKDVDIAYGFDEPILKDVFLEIRNQEKVFMVGESGSGKSTLAKTMAGLVEYKKGEILYNGNHETRNSDAVIYLSQEAEIFSGTIRENILMWQESVDIEKFEEVLYNVGIYKMMEMRGLSLDSYLQENGINLSGGEKQRIAIARALLYSTSIYIFDEATCHLDVESEKHIIDYIKTRLNDKTCIFISHNTNLIEEEDTIIYIDQNRNICCERPAQLNNEYKYKTK